MDSNIINMSDNNISLCENSQIKKIHSSRPPLASRASRQTSSKPSLALKRFDSFLSNNKSSINEEKENVNLSYSKDSKSTRNNSNKRPSQTRLQSAKNKDSNLKIDTLHGRSNSINKNNQNEQVKDLISLSIVNSHKIPLREVQSSKSSNSSLIRGGLYNKFETFEKQMQLQNIYKNDSLSKKQSLANINKPIHKQQSDNHLEKQSTGVEDLNRIRAQSTQKSRIVSAKPFQSQNTDISKQSSLQEIPKLEKNEKTERQRKLNPFTINVPLPYITAQSWAIFDLQANKLIQGKKENLKREVASITKMMTFYTSLILMQKYQIDGQQLVTVSRQASLVTGTSACLREGDQLTLQQLFYGLMLPSGNDAAFCLAEYFGNLLHLNKYQSTVISSYQFPDSIVRYFIKEMNLNAYKLRMFNTQYDSPHGLMNKHNFSTAHDICLLSQKCMQIEQYRQVVKTKQFKTQAISSIHNKKLTNYNWENTNKLLDAYDGCVGCKTGITDAAGPCFSGCFERDGERLIIVVLCSKTMDQRWIEVPKMFEWVVKRKRINEEYDNRKQNNIVRIP